LPIRENVLFAAERPLSGSWVRGLECLKVADSASSKSFGRRIGVIDGSRP